MTSSRLNAKARAYMKSHPGVNYTEALAIVSRKQEPLLGGAMSDMLSRIVGAGTPTPDLESAMQSLGFEFPPKEGGSDPIAPSDARTGDVVKVNDRYGMLLDTQGSVLLDGKLLNITDVAEENLEFFRMPAPAENAEDAMLEEAKRYAEKIVFETDGTLQWDTTPSPLYAIQRGDVLECETFGGAVYLGKGQVRCSNGGSVAGVADVGDITQVWRASVANFNENPHPRDSAPQGTRLLSVISPLTTDNVVERWKRNEFTNHLYVPLGFDGPDMRVFGIDLAETATGGTGPHGCIQGSTGSGKTALAKNLVYALASDNSPTKVTFAFVDFKGSACADELGRLPHTVFSRGNLEADEGSREEEFRDFIAEEMSRRESVLHAHAARDHITYTRMRSEDDSLPPLPRLVVVVEEAHEAMRMRLGHTREALTSIAAKGRALGIHLVVVSQVFDPVVFRELMVHMVFGVSLRTHSAAASRTVLHVSGAENLPLGKGDAMIRYSERNWGDTVASFRILVPMVGAEREAFVAAMSHAASDWEALRDIGTET